MRRLVIGGSLIAGLAFMTPDVMGIGPSVDEGRESVKAPVAVQVATPVTGLRDEAAMVLVGTVLIGLAAAVRRAG